MHKSQLSGLVQLQTRDASAVRKQRGLGELTKLLAVHKGFQNILLYLQIAVDDVPESIPQWRKILHGLTAPVIGRSIVGGRRRAQEETIADILLEEALAVVAADH